MAAHPVCLPRVRLNRVENQLHELVQRLVLANDLAARGSPPLGTDVGARRLGGRPAPPDPCAIDAALVPRPGAIGGEFRDIHDDVLYGNREELVEKLSRLLVELPRPNHLWADKLRRLALSMNRFSWQTLISSYDEELDRLSAIASPRSADATPST